MLKPVLIAIAVGLLASCATQKPQAPTLAERGMATVQQTIQVAAENERAAQTSIENSPIPQAVTDALMAGSAPVSVQEDERFNISVNQIPARTFFLSLVADSGVNVVAHPDVSGTISLELNNVSVDEVLEVTRDVYGYQYKLSNGIYTIYPRKIRTEIFHINYLDIERSGTTDTSVLIGAIVSEDKNGTGGGSNSNKNKASDDSSGSRVKTLNKTNFWKLLQQTLTAIVGEEEPGRMVVVNPQAGLVVVKAMPAELHAIREFLDKSELSVRRQVILETKILEIKLYEGFEAGVNWGAIQGQLQLTNNVDTFDSSGITVASEATGEIFASIFKVGNILDLVSLLESQGDVQVLSSPRVSTVNNQKALIRVGSDEFFVTGISSNQTSTASSTTTTPNIELTSFFSGISLDVTPQIADNGEVILHVHPIVSDVVDQVKDFTVGDEAFSLPMALRDIRESDSIVRAKSGQVVVLGGLMKEMINDVVKKTPVLGNIPGVNSLFKHRQKVAEKTELVILLRPILVDEDSLQNDINDSHQRIRRLSDEYRTR